MDTPDDAVGHEPDPLHAVAYLSTPTTPFSDRDLSELLLAARLWNVRHGVTGKLVALEADGRLVRFAQWIEGPRAELEACVRRILADPRHADFDVRRRGPVDARRFPEWDMAVQTVPANAFGPASDALAAA